jgi:hypothetical protein
VQWLSEGREREKRKCEEKRAFIKAAIFLLSLLSQDGQREEKGKKIL